MDATSSDAAADSLGRSNEAPVIGTEATVGSSCAGTSVGMTTSAKSASETAAVPSGSITGSMTSAGGRSPGSTTLMSSMKSQ